MPNYYLVKSEPYVFSFADLLRDGRAMWDGVRNFEARNNLRAMQKGDLLLFYHSNEGKAVVGVATVITTAYADPTADPKNGGEGGDWSVVDVAPVCALHKPVTLDDIRKEPRLQQINLLRRSRLSVVPVTAAEFDCILQLGQTPLPDATRQTESKPSPLRAAKAVKKTQDKAQASKTSPSPSKTSKSKTSKSKTSQNKSRQAPTKQTQTRKVQTSQTQPDKGSPTRKAPSPAKQTGHPSRSSAPAVR